MIAQNLCTFFKKNTKSTQDIKQKEAVSLG